MLRIVVLAVLLVGIVHAEDYCALCSDHTMCIYPGNGPKCERIMKQGVSEEDQKVIVDLHNELRNKVALGEETRGSNGGEPSATNMKKLTWDPELATVAQRWADQCDFGHDKCRKVERFNVGQNVYISLGGCSNWNPVLNFDSSVQSWYNEVENFDKNNISPFRFTPNTGHYTQVVWAVTDKVGCGYTSYESKGMCYNFVVCNYGVAGNLIGGDMYKQGAAGSDCGDKDSQYPGLCT